MKARLPAPGRRVRLVALDIDGTLLRCDRTISPRTRAALEPNDEDGVARAIEEHVLDG